MNSFEEFMGFLFYKEVFQKFRDIFLVLLSERKAISFEKISSNSLIL
jgi:hypothetical protein